MNILESEKSSKFKECLDNTSISRASRRFLTQLQYDLTVEGALPIKGPVLLVSNHPSIVDLFLVAAAAERDDLYLVGLAAFQEIHPKIADKLLPVYRQYKPKDLLITNLGFSKKHIENSSTRQIRAKNRASISDAAAKVSQGSSVVIFPTGSGGSAFSTRHWKSGVGHLITQIENPYTQIILTHISGTNFFSALRLLPDKYSNWLVSHKQVSVHFSPPISIQNIQQQNDGKQTTIYLEKIYSEYFDLK